MKIVRVIKHEKDDHSVILENGVIFSIDWADNDLYMISHSFSIIEDSSQLRHQAEELTSFADLIDALENALGEVHIDNDTDSTHDEIIINIELSETDLETLIERYG